ncbi:hypothetical protein BsWGS_26973 [Bradybaena similaris]
MSGAIFRHHTFSVGGDRTGYVSRPLRRVQYQQFQIAFTSQKDKERQDQLSEILNRYSLHGLPPFPELLSLGRPKFDDTIFELESSWKSIVVSHESLTKKQQEHQEAVWELLLTEVSYIKQIRVIIDVFQNCLINVQQESFLNEIETERLFSNIDKVFECNCVFWQQYLLPVLQRGRDCRQPLDPLLSKEGFVDHFPSMFQVYFKFFIEHKSCLEYAKSCMENSDLFKIFIQWAEAQKQCNRLKLADILVKPMQRLLKYSLLLQAVLRFTENSKDRTEIQEMIQSIDKLCWAANNSLRRREDYEKLEAVRKTIDPFDAIEAPNDECAKIIQEYNGSFNLLAPMPGFRDGPRSLLFHSSLRMREGQSIKLDIDCLLFTDLILICKSNKRMERFKIIRPPMRLDQLVVSELKDKGSFLLIYMNEYQVPISAFTFHSDTGAVRLWVDKFREAQRDFKMKKIQESAELEILRKDSTAAQSDIEGATVLSVPSYLELASTALPRSESTESADRFMPNLLTPNDFPADTGQSDISRSGSTGDIHNHPVTLSTHRDLPHANTDPKLGNLSSADLSSMQQITSESLQGNSLTLTTKHKPVQTSRSVPNIMVGTNNGTSPGASPPSKQINTFEENQGFKDTLENFDHLSLSTSSQSKDIYHSASEGSLSEQNSISDEEEMAKLKLHSRRVSRNEKKRYHTADAIQDIKNSEKDNSIHKRLSWRTDVAMDHKNLGSKTVSTDSVRSVPSSSGVSSIGSLHLTVDTEISEEQEGNSNDSDNYSGGSPTRSDRLKLFSVGDTEDIDLDDDGDDLSAFADSKQSKSKSTSDLATVFSNVVQVSQMKDGIASVAVATDNFSRKLTHAEILKMKKLKHQVLYDANIESSEV